MSIVHKFLLTLTFTSFFLFSFTNDVLAHAGHDHPEEETTITITQTPTDTLPTPTVVVAQETSTPLWIPAATVVGGIVVGVLGIFFIHTRFLHPKDK